MERRLSVADVMSLYNCGRDTAVKRMRQMIHMEKPLMVRERDLIAWENAKMVYPVEKPVKGKKLAYRRD